MADRRGGGRHLRLRQLGGGADGGGRAHLRPVLRPEPSGQRAVHGRAPDRAAGARSASGSGNLAVLLGSSTGRDGIGGVSVLASAGFGGGDDGAEAAKRPSVQVGDPYEEKRLIEACLELLDAKLVVGIQDLGGAGLVCATCETAARGGVGMDVDVSAVARREPGMAPYEVMTSESQERMLAIVTPDDLARVEEVCRRWEVRAAVVGRVTDPPAGQPGRLRILDGFDGAVLADVPAAALSDDAPLLPPPAGATRRSRGACRRRSRRPAGPVRLRAGRRGPAVRPVVDLPPVRPPALPEHRRRPGGDAAVLRLAAPGLPPSEQGVGPDHRLQPGAGAPSIPGPAPRPPWPSAPSTWPAPEPGRWPWSTASTSATPSTPR